MNERNFWYGILSYANSDFSTYSQDTWIKERIFRGTVRQTKTPIFVDGCFQVQLNLDWEHLTHLSVSFLFLYLYYTQYLWIIQYFFNNWKDVDYSSTSLVLALLSLSFFLFSCSLLYSLTTSYISSLVIVSFS